jgi:hypothetical protein
VLKGKSLITVVSVNGVVAGAWLEGRMVVRPVSERRTMIERILTGLNSETMEHHMSKVGGRKENI